jgi:uncharacterized protein DUF6815
MATLQKRKMAIVWRGDPAKQLDRVPEKSRLYPVALALEACGFVVEPVVYSESVSSEVRDRLMACNGVLAWVDPLDAGRDRSDLDAILRHVAANGVWVGSHPDVILRMGTKEVLYRTRDVGWGADTHLYETFEEFRRAFPERLRESGTRVLKRYRGNGGQGVWKVTSLPGDLVSLQQATDRDGSTSQATLAQFIASCETYFTGEGRLIDQPFQPRIVEGMVRCYLCADEVVGFARQFAAGHAEGAPNPKTFGLPAAKTMFPPTEAQFARLRQNLEREWIPRMMTTLALERARLPVLWDADFLFGPKTADGEDTYVLCEINASCITPFPPEAPAKITDHATRMLTT